MIDTRQYGYDSDGLFHVPIDEYPCCISNCDSMISEGTQCRRCTEEITGEYVGVGRLLVEAAKWMWAKL